jgi:hypothetical protein
MNARTKGIAGAGLAVAAALVIAWPTLSPAGEPSAEPRAERAVAYALPAARRLQARAAQLGGPRVIGGVPVLGRRIDMWGSTSGRRRMLVAGCVNGWRCGGEDVVGATETGCPPDDVDTWLMRSLRPGGEDLDEQQDTRGAQAWRRAVGGLRPDLAVVFRTGPAGRGTVYAAGRSAAAGRRFATLAGLRFVPTQREGLASWAASALTTTRAMTVELPPGRPGSTDASRMAYALDKLVGTRFADGAQEDRLRMIESGMDPRTGKA